MEELIAYFRKSLFISEEIENRLESIISEKNIEKGEVILAENSFKKEHIFVVSGCLRSFYKTENGKEHTIQFAIKNWWISDYITLYTENESTISIESLTHSKILILKNEDLKKVYEEFPQFEVFQRNNFEKRIATLQKRILSLLAFSASEKYHRFVNDYKDFEKIIPNYQIASFLGITPESLSRIRKERAKE